MITFRLHIYIKKFYVKNFEKLKCVNIIKKYHKYINKTINNTATLSPTQTYKMNIENATKKFNKNFI